MISLSIPDDLPPRVLDLMTGNRLAVDALKFIVLDEADRMFDMGFTVSNACVCNYM